MVKGHRLDANLHFAFARRRRRGHVGKFKLAVGDKSERTHDDWLV
jgi:hypothetical protein